MNNRLQTLGAIFAASGVTAIIDTAVAAGTSAIVAGPEFVGRNAGAYGVVAATCFIVMMFSLFLCSSSEPLIEE